MKKLKFILTLTCVSLMTLSTIMAQQTSNYQLTLEDLLPGGNSYSKYQVKMPKGIQWYNDIATYIKGDSILAIKGGSNTSSQFIISKDEINQILSDNNKDKIVSLAGISFIGKDNSLALVKIKNGYVTIDMKTKSIINSFELSKDAQNIDFSEKYESVAYTKKNNLYLLSKNTEIAITNDSSKSIVNGQSVHRNEFGINKGIFWSPDGNKLAFYRMDENMVTDYPLVDVSTRIASLKDIKYPMAGMKSHHVTLGIYDILTNKTTFLKTGLPKEKYLTNIAWAPDNKSIYIAELNRGQDTCQLKQYDIATGKQIKLLFEELDTKYVEPEHPIHFLPNNSQSFIWQSKRDRHNHIYLYATDGSLKRQLTSGEWDVTNVLGFDTNGNNLFYSSTENSPIENHLYKLDLKTGNRIKISKEEGLHYGILSPSAKYIIDRYTSQYNPGKIVITNTSNNVSSEFYQADSPFKNIKLPEINLGSLTANDGKTKLFYRMVKPVDFDTSKKYPVVIYVYGGPHSQLVDNSWMGQVRGWDIYMAEKGYIVFTLDNRGTNNRGKKFEDITHRKLGVVETEDQMTGVNYLKSLTYVDADRIGVHGWSFGGFMTLNLMLRHPEVFKVGVAGGPVTDWKYYEIMYGERYMDSPQENPQGYAETSMIDRAGDLKGRLMLIHGDEDPTVVMQHSLLFLKSAIKKGTHPDFFVYPGHGHNMTGHDRVHLHEHITRYFDDFLK